MASSIAEDCVSGVMPNFSGHTFEKVWASIQEFRQELDLYLRKSQEDI